MGIRSKLIIALLLANGLLAGLMFWLTSQSFDRGFIDYINRVEVQKLQPLLGELARYHKRYQGWGWIHQQRWLWHDLMVKYVTTGQAGVPLGEEPPMPDGNPARPASGVRQPLGRPPPPPGFPPPGLGPGAGSPFDPRVLLRDTDGQLVIGNPRQVDNSIWLPIVDGEQTLGELGVLPRSRLSAQVDRLFVFQQKQNFAVIIAGVVIIALSLALALAMFFLKPIKGISQGVHQLAAGNFKTRIADSGRDELGQLALDINRLAEILAQNQRARQQWIADISHELRTPVTIIQGELDALVEGVRKAEPANLESLQQEARRLGQLIGDLHELALSDLGAISYRFDQADLNELVNDFVGQYRSQIEAAGLTLQWESPIEIVGSVIDEDRLLQLLTNLMQNTLRYTDTPGRLRIGLSRSGQQAQLVWEDSAPAVADDDLPRLFERLYRVDKSRNRARGGAGLGLSICSSIVQAHNGTMVAFHSELGGLGVRISLPLSQRGEQT